MSEDVKCRRFVRIDQIHNCDRGDPLETQRAYAEDHQDMNNHSLKCSIRINNTVFDVVKYKHEVIYTYECIA